MQAQTLHFAQKLTQNGSQVDPNVTCKNIKFLHDIRRENLDDLGYGDDFLKAEIDFFWNSLAFLMIQWMLAICSLIPLPFVDPV